jgi:hypothetical protein
MRRLLIFIVLTLSFHLPLEAQDYYFSVPSAQLEVRVQPSGGAILYYRIEFKNTPAGHAIEIVDIGMPHEDYDAGEAKAWVNGTEVHGPIKASELVKPGLEVHLGHLAIPPDGSGTFEFETSVPDLVFQDTTRKDYASLQITPTWFGEQYVVGSTDLTIRVVLPSGIKPDEVLHQGIQFAGKDIRDNGTVAVRWEVNRRFTSDYRVGVSFPKRVMSRVVTMTIPQLLMRWWRGQFSTQTRGYLGLAAAVILFIIYLRFTGGTGCVLFFPLVLIPFLIVGAFLFGKYDVTEIFIWPVLLILAVIVETARKRRRSKYLPAIASVEGGGIKRGLTAPEAAVLLELPVNKVVTLVLFGMMKKGLINQTSKEPVMFQAAAPPPVEAIAHDYEKEFLKLLKQSKHATAISRIDFSKPIKALVDSVAKRMVGYDLDETQSYYRHIISRAWKEAQEIGEVEAWQKKMDEKVDWMMLDPDFTGRFRPFEGRYIPRSYRSGPISTSGGAPTSGAPPSSGSSPRFSDVAASVSGWFQNTASGVVGAFEGQKGGIVNLGSIDKAIGKAMQSSGGGGRGGGGGGCACACAGCACACACAGGGR